MKQTFVIVVFILSVLSVSSVYGQQDDEAARNRTRERLAGLLETSSSAINVNFKQSQNQPYNFVGSLTSGVVNAQSFEIVISISAKNTIGFRVYPHYNNGYINVDKVRDRLGFTRLLLRLSDRAFLFWGADEVGDVFTGYTFTLESGFPEEAIKIVLRSIVNSDQFIGEMRPFIDGSKAAPVKTQ